MANEIKNRQHAAALIAPVPAPPFTTEIVKAVGIDSFVRNSAGNYTLGLLDAAPFDASRASAALGANVLGTIGAQLAADGASVLVTAFDALGLPFDPQFFSVAVDTIRDGEGVGPAPAPPAPPVAPAFPGSQLLGWAQVTAAGAISAQSPAGLVTGVVVSPVGIYDYTLVAGTQLAALHAFQDGLNQGQIVGEVQSPTTAQIRTADATGAGAARDHFAYFYQL